MSEQVGPTLRFISAATPDEVAAVTAVLQGAVDELAETASPVSPVSAWNRSQRAVHGDFAIGAGGWRGFSV
jgi:hypothetical protein